MKFHIEIDRGYPKKKRDLVRLTNTSLPRVFPSRESARQFIRSHNLSDRNPKIVPVEAARA